MGRVFPHKTEKKSNLSIAPSVMRVQISFRVRFNHRSPLHAELVDKLNWKRAIWQRLQRIDSNTVFFDSVSGAGVVMRSHACSSGYPPIGICLAIKNWARALIIPIMLWLRVKTFFTGIRSHLARRQMNWRQPLHLRNRGPPYSHLRPNTCL